MNGKRFGWFFLGFLLTGAGWASGIAVMESNEDGKNTTIIEYGDNGEVRMSFPDEKKQNGYMLIRDGRAYMVSIDNGQTMVMDMQQLGGMARGMGTPIAQDAFKQELIDARRLGRKETVAGYRGDVYSITWRDSEGTHTEEAVLSSHRDVRELSDAWMHMAEAMASAVGRQAMEDDSIWDFMQKEGKAPLRMGKEYRVVSIKSQFIDPARFVLPAAPMQMPSFGDFGGMDAAGQQAQEQQPEQDSWSNFFGQKTDRQVERQKRNAEYRTDRAVDRAVDKAVDGVLKGVFGW